MSTGPDKRELPSESLSMKTINKEIDRLGFHTVVECPSVLKALSLIDC